MANPSANETFKKVSEILKRVDALIKSQDLDRARTEALHAKELDPRNMYAHAYCERIESLILQRKQNQELDHARWLEEEAARAKREQEQKREEEKNRPSREKELSAYTGALFEAWKAGAPSPQSEQRLRTLRQSLYIAPEEHSNMELMVRREYYAQEFRRLWLSEKDVEDGPATIKSLRKRWCINGGESESIEFELLNQLRQPASCPVVLLIDDDEDLLMAMTVLLRDSGFEIRPFTTADAAYDFLLHSTPDIILADINLETSSMGGFAFFERVQQLPRLSSIPFLFVSGLTDEIVIRAGKELGVDDYITKPFDNDELVSAIRGKLRRYAELRRISSN